MSDTAPLPICILAAHVNPQPVQVHDLYWLMNFTVQAGPFRFSDVGFGVERGRNGFFFFLPRANRRCRSLCTDKATRQAILSAALAVYTAKGGPDLHSAVLPPATAREVMEPKPQ